LEGLTLEKRTYRILTLNPGSTSTKVALFEDDAELWSDTQRYDVDVIHSYAGVMDQEEFRLEAIRDALERHDTPIASLDAVVGRGGLLKPIPGGTYLVGPTMIEDLKSCRWGSHASNLGAPLAARLASEAGHDRAFIVDPVVVDELVPEARLSGIPEIERRSIFHALNQKAVARRAARDLGKAYEEVNLVVAHMGGGISVGAHEAGRVIDVNNALDGEGPFSPERAGSLPAGEFMKLCFSGTYNLDQVMKKLVGKGGLVAHLGTNDLREVVRRVDEGDAKAAMVFEAMAYQVSREIGSRAAALKGRVDAVILTGGLAYSTRFTDLIASRVAFIAPVRVYPGEDESAALAEGALRVLRGEEEPRKYA
jgi:butyrate kinase